MVVLKPTILIIPLYKSGLNALINRQGFIDWIQKQNLTHGTYKKCSLNISQ